MAFRELQAMQVAYELLSPLDPNARQRVMAWLAAALADESGAPTTVDGPAAPQAWAETELRNSVVEVAAEHAAAVPDAQTAASAVGAAATAEPELAVEPQPVAAPAPDARPRRSRSAKATGRRAARAARPAPPPAKAAPPRRGERPSGEQFLADLAAVGTFKALAEKYGKSIGTIGNWANQLREQGVDIPVGRQKKS
jgi:cell division septation protein DedD